MKELLVLTHNGMGDHLVCNGLVRSLAKSYPRVSIVCKLASVESVRFMYRDENRIRIVTVSDDNQISPAFGASPVVLRNLEHAGFEIMLLGLHRGWLPPGSGFANAFYNQADVAREKRYSAFHVERDFALEESFKTDGDYVFVHDDAERGMVVNPNTTLPIIRPGKADHRPFSNNIFAFAGLMENAAECHCVDSSFAHLADHLDLCAGRRFLHCNAKNSSDHVEALFLRPGWVFVR